jgi:hypothetical protein
MLADANEIDAELVGENGLVDDIADDLGSSPSSILGFIIRISVLRYLHPH